MSHITMNILRNLQHAFECDNLKALAQKLGKPERTIYGWNAQGIPGDKIILLELILKQKQLIENLKTKLEEMKNE